MLHCSFTHNCVNFFQLCNNDFHHQAAPSAKAFQGLLTLNFFKSPYYIRNHHVDYSLSLLSCRPFASYPELVERGFYACFLTFSIFHAGACFPPFALMQKVEPKNQGKPKWLRLFCRPRTTTLRFSLYQSPTYNHIVCILTYTTFSKAHSAAVLTCDIH